MKNATATILKLVLLAGAPVLLSSATIATDAYAHGSFEYPLSRVYGCRLENPESPKSDACKAAVAVGGTQPLYDWNEVNIANAAGQHQKLIPDGKLCSAGRDKYKAFDAPRTDWAATNLPSGAAVTLRFKATAAHRGTFDIYTTRNGYNPTQPLKWSDLEKFSSATDPQLVNGVYQIPVRTPAGKTGRHIIYAVWQRSDSPEAFYTCSDVVYN